MAELNTQDLEIIASIIYKHYAELYKLYPAVFSKPDIKDIRKNVEYLFPISPKYRPMEVYRGEGPNSLEMKGLKYRKRKI
jgi:hypothetical protein